MDENSNVVLAFTVAAACFNQNGTDDCTEVHVLAYQGGVATASEVLHGDGIEGSNNRFVRMAYNHLELPHIQIADGYALLKTEYMSRYCGPTTGCGNDHETVDAIPLEVQRPRWHDPADSERTDYLQLVDWSASVTNSASGFYVIEIEMTVRGDRPIASNADFQQGRPASHLNFICFNPPGSTNPSGSSGSIFPLAEDLISTVDDTRIYRRVISGSGQFAGECRGENLYLRDLTGDVWADFRTPAELETAGFQRTWAVESGFTRSVEMRLAYPEEGGFSHDVILVRFPAAPDATIACYRAGSSEPYEIVTAPTIGSPDRTAQRVCSSRTPGEHWAVVDGVRSNSVVWGSSGPPSELSWVPPTPDNGSRFDLRPGETTRFTVTATDPAGGPVTISTRYFEARPDGAERPQPGFITCVPATAVLGTSSLTCTVAPTANGLAVLAVNASNSSGESASERRYLIGASNLKYVALGDSYSAGEGVSPFFRDGYDATTGVQTGKIDNRCHRSSKAYSTMLRLPGMLQPFYVTASGNADPGSGRGYNKYGSDLNVRTFDGTSWVFLACSGAVTDNVLPEDEGGDRQQSETEGFREIHSQLSYPYVDFGTDLVTISIGGNNLNFSNVVQFCASTSCLNDAGFVASVDARIDQLEPELTKVYESINRRTFGTRVLVLGYPHLFPDDQRFCPKLAPWNGERDFLNAKTDKMNDLIRRTAESAGLEYVDVNDAALGELSFIGHEVCGVKGEWINGTSFAGKKKVIDDSSFHPTDLGQFAFAAILQLHLQQHPSPG